MKKPKRVRRKARFRVGEVVRFRDDHWLYRKITGIFGTDYERITQRFEYVFGGEDYSRLESELRPLTAKEIGTRR